jgi:hypothetical protein
MSLLHLLMVLIAVGIILYCVNRFIPMDGNIRKILNAVVIICVVFFLLDLFGVFGPLSQIRVGR